MVEMMRAVVAGKAGPPDVLEVREVPVPEPRPGWTLVRVEAAGLNRSELMTRQGLSPDVRFPRVLGIECVGTVAATSGAGLPAGTTVAAVMGDMGRAFDGGYAEYALLPDELLMPVTTSLDWEVLGALPETYLTAYGSLAALGADTGAGGTLLVRGATSSVGMAALSLAADHGLETIATTRNPAKAELLTARGAHHVVVDNAPGAVADQVRRIKPGGPEYVLDLIGAPTVIESLELAARGGTVCMAGILSGVWVIPEFYPTGMIPSGTKLTSFQSNDAEGAAGAAALQRIVAGVERGAYHANVDRVFPLEEAAEAHRYMEENRATGKVVLRTR